jgi:hypothetical protein
MLGKSYNWLFMQAIGCHLDPQDHAMLQKWREPRNVPSSSTDEPRHRPQAAANLKNLTLIVPRFLTKK